MPTYRFTAIDVSSGQEQAGTMAGASAMQVTQDLKAQGLQPIQLELDGPSVTAPAFSAKNPARRWQESWAASRWTLPGMTEVSGKELTLFTRQLATLVRAGMPLLRGLEVLARQQRSPGFKQVLIDLAETIRAGGSLSDGLAQHDKLFSRLYLNMVNAGEASGALAEILQRLAAFLEKSQKIQGKVRAAMTYPLIIMVVALGVVGALIVFVIPRFESIFSNLLKGQPLPPLTQFVLRVSESGQGNLLIFIGGGIAAIMGLRWGVKTRRGARVWDKLRLITPWVGDLMLKSAVARFTRTLGTLLASGVQILPALQITRDTAGNVLVAEAVDTVQARVRAGEGMARPLSETGVFPEMVASMIEVGEEIGQLPAMLERVADTYEEEVDNAVNALTSILEPVMIVLMAVVVGTIVIALFLPLVRIMQTLS